MELGRWGLASTQIGCFFLSLHYRVYSPFGASMTVYSPFFERSAPSEDSNCAHQWAVLEWCVPDPCFKIKHIATT
eukprot:scaffold110755_cov21-Tisochrysis_lutea.AAC.2